MTHNSSMNYNRQVSFIGKGTDCINRKNLCYSDILFWDYTNKRIDKSNSRTGFFYQGKNSLSEIKHFYIDTIKYVFYCIRYIYIKISQELNNIGISLVMLWDNRFDGIDCLYEVNICDIMKWFKEVSLKNNFNQTFLLK